MRTITDADIGAGLPGGKAGLPDRENDPGKAVPKPGAPGEPLQPEKPEVPYHPKPVPDHDPDVPEKPGPPLEDPDSPHPARKNHARIVETATNCEPIAT
jgi:hypothetical protein